MQTCKSSSQAELAQCLSLSLSHAASSHEQFQPRCFALFGHEGSSRIAQRVGGRGAGRQGERNVESVPRSVFTDACGHKHPSRTSHTNFTHLTSSVTSVWYLSTTLWVCKNCFWNLCALVRNIADPPFLCKHSRGRW